MNPIEAEYEDIVSRNAWLVVYQGIRQKSEKLKFTFIEAKKPKNSVLNRYMDVNPFDHTRIVLQGGQHDYINANIVKMERANRQYILTQGPLESTASHFWLMVWEQNCRIILMLNNIIEKDQIKCHWYWPPRVGTQYAMDLTDVGLNLQQVSEETHTFFCQRTFRLTEISSGEWREVIQYHYTTWPDFGVPSSPHAFLEFLRQVRASGGLEPSVGPAVVHCSAGIGRSGTFCLVDSCLVLVEKDGLESVNVQEILLQMREYRMGLIQTPDQLRFSYQAIIEGVKSLDPNYKKVELVAEETEAEAPPPPPPPRAESLRAPPARPLPPPPESPADNGCLPKDLQPSDEDDQQALLGPGELRKRRNFLTKATVERMQRKQADSERWRAFKKSLVKPVAITVGLLLCGTLVYYYVKN